MMNAAANVNSKDRRFTSIHLLRGFSRVVVYAGMYKVVVHYTLNHTDPVAMVMGV